MKIKLAEALLKRKELEAKVRQLSSINQKDLYELKMQRKPVHEGIDDILAQVPKVAINQVTHAYDTHAKNLRLVDAAIQQANWATEVEIDEKVMQDYVDPYIKV